MLNPDQSFCGTDLSEEKSGVEAPVTKKNLGRQTSWKKQDSQGERLHLHKP